MVAALSYQIEVVEFFCSHIGNGIYFKGKDELDALELLVEYNLESTDRERKKECVRILVKESGCDQWCL